MGQNTAYPAVYLCKNQDEFSLTLAIEGEV
jgi:hypothetical protein